MNNLSRRKFIRNSAIAGGLMALPGSVSALPGFTSRYKSGSDAVNIPQDELLKYLTASRDRIKGATDTVCLERARLFTEAYRMFEGEPVPVLRAKALNHFLKNMTIDLQNTPLFAGNTTDEPRGWLTIPEDGFSVPSQAIVEKPSLKGLMDGDAIPGDLRMFWKDKPVNPPRGHLIVNNKLLLEKGLSYVIELAQQPADDHGVEVFRKACAISCQAVIDWSNRYAVAAEEEMKITEDPTLKQVYLLMAAACRHVPARPARNMYEALQSMALVHLAMHFEGHRYSVSPGRLDQLLLPYYRAEEPTAELLAGFMLKIFANNVYGSHSKTQTITLGGVDRDGNDQCNPVTLEVLNALELIKTNDPLIFLRWHENISDEVKNKAITMLMSGMAMPMLVGDEETARGFINYGVKEQDAWNYAVLGCNELGIPGKMIFQATTIWELSALRDVLTGSYGEQPVSLDALMDQTAGKAKTDLRNRLEGHLKSTHQHGTIYPTPFTSSLMDGCIERGKDLAVETEYPFINIRSVGFANLVDAFAAIDHVVYQNQAVDLSEVIRAIENNYEEAGLLQKKLLDAPRWGNDNDYVDDIALKWLKMRRKILEELEKEFDCPTLIEELVTRSLHHVEGKRIKATPDGRNDFTPLSDSVGAPMGASTSGPTALCNSVCKMQPALYWPGGYNFNITFPLVKSEGDMVTRKIKTMVDVFFSNGGQEYQISALDESVLLDALEHPEKYPHLMVRIAGFNGYFTQLSEVEQWEMIERARACSF